MSRMIGGFLLAGLVLAGASVGVAQAADGDCKLATKGDSEVVKACKEGGVKKAKLVMKDMTKRAKAAGMKTDCDGCHKADHYDQLTDDGRKKFDEMIALLNKKK